MSRHSHLWLAVLIASMVFLAACGPAPTPSTGGSAEPTATIIGPQATATDQPLVELTGTEWELVSLNGQSPIEGSDATLAFYPDNYLEGTSGCNSFGSDYVLAGREFRLVQVNRTSFACQEPAGIAQQDEALFEALSRIAAYQASADRLSFEDVAGETVLVYAPDIPVEADPALRDTEWLLTSLLGDDLLAGSRITLNLGLQAFGGFAGCNNYGGEYEAAGSGILLLSDIAHTEMDCHVPEGVMEQEAAYVEALGSSAAYRLSADRLELANDSGDTILEYVRKEQFATDPGALVGTGWRLLSVDGEPLDEGLPFSLAFFSEEILGGHAGCRDYLATYQVSGDNLTLLTETMLDAGCRVEDADLERESQVLGVLAPKADLRLGDGQLEIQGEKGGVLAFEALPREANLDLEGQTWSLLASVGPNPYVEEPDAWPMPLGLRLGTTIDLVFEGDSVRGSAGCNSYGAAYSRDGTSIRFERITVTEMACLDPEGVMEQEVQYLELLGEVTAQQVFADYLWLETGDGQALLFNAAASLPPADETGSPGTGQPTDLLLELSWEGGLVRPEFAYAFGRIAEFSLWSDGSVFYRDPSEWDKAQVMVARLAPAERDALVQRVLDLGFEHLESYTDQCQDQADGSQECVMDAGRSVLRVRLADGNLREVTNYFSFANDPDALDAIRTLLQEYRHPQAELYVPDRAALITRPVSDGSDLDLADWPLDPAKLGGDLYAPCVRVLSGADLRTLVAASGRNLGMMTFRAGDQVFSVYLVPWLPGVDYGGMVASSGLACPEDGGEDPSSQGAAALCVRSGADAASSRLVVQEHPLSRPPAIAEEEGPAFEIAGGDTAGILAANLAYRDVLGLRLASGNDLLRPFGYHLKMTQCAGPGQRATFALYSGEEVITEPLLDFAPVSVNASATDFAMQIELSDGTYLLTRDDLERRSWGYNPPVYVNDELMTVRVSDTIQVLLGDEPVYEVPVIPSPINNVALDSPWTYDGHWVMEFIEISQGTGGDQGSGRLVQDGQDMNQVCGYEESFQFTLLDGRPFYFIRRAGMIDMVYDGEKILQGYDEIPHYLCCSASALNPGSSQNMVWFFARRGELWYYVEAYVPLATMPLSTLCPVTGF